MTQIHRAKNENHKDKNIKIDTQTYENKIRNENIKDKIEIVPIEKNL